MILAPAQCRAARDLLDWSVEDLVVQARVTLDQIRNFESGRSCALPVIEALYRAFHANGIRFTPTGGVDIDKDQLLVIEGAECYLRLLEEVERVLIKHEESTRDLLILFASDRVSPPSVNAQYRRMRRAGIRMRQIISSEETYVMGPFEEYRTMPARYFTNVVTLIYADRVAQVNGPETRITVQTDAALAARERKTFEFIWDQGAQPTMTEAVERFE